MKYMVPFSLLSVIFISIFLFGCGSDRTQPTDSSSPSTSDGHVDHSHQGMNGQSDMEKMNVALSKLSTEDAASAEKQHVCPVSGKMLGVMGPPQKVDANGQPVWICCDGCKDKLLSNLDEYLAKLKKE
ncbi:MULTISPECIES: hypothetical protein [Gimesia]|jgi:Cu(I)/Ag(I) efflux system membrane fusion protein|uniref:hypothetical protein n=1 Tax=Gimesia TaxID=1649453 RepID=UPI0032EC8724|tara:strand:- start:702 stop:1085 length:384 start_codon:yes stop_codon:yes gene_type:complete